ncbi:MAG: hypothetical protein JEZ07_01770 [Phycisphaerae bacterium]|nr:hypothetical protein [Phycisphaerae bacterium]
MWDYLIITASNDAQAQGYRDQLDLRSKLGLLPEVNSVLVVADPDGKRIGSGGSTLFCLMEVLGRQLDLDPDLNNLREILSNLRILIIHAGGDSKRLPAYGPCGKIFVPVPGDSDTLLPMTLFDRQLPTYLALPAPVAGVGQVVITSGDVILNFDPTQISFDKTGLTGLGCYAPPEQAANHGVFCGFDSHGKVKKFLQKPTPTQQQSLGAVDHYGQSVLDIGVMNFDAETATKLLGIFGLYFKNEGDLAFSGEMAQAVIDHGLDFYREICCGMGTEVTSAHHSQMAKASGSTWNYALLGRLLQGLESIEFNLELLKQCDFIDFGTTAQVIRSGTSLVQQDRGAPSLHFCLDINNLIHRNGHIVGANSWVEGCRINAPLHLEGNNVVVGVDINEPLLLAKDTCLDMIAGFARNNKPVYFIRCYGVNDTFKDTIENNATFCNLPISQWINAVNARNNDVWDDSITDIQRTLWNAKLFVTTDTPEQYRNWIWMFDPSRASDEQINNWYNSDRYSLAEIAFQIDQDKFFQRRHIIRAEQIKNNLRYIFRPDSEFSAGELSSIVADSDDQTGWISALITEAIWHYDNGMGMNSLVFPRIIHTLATVLENITYKNECAIESIWPQLEQKLSSAENDWLADIGLNINSGVTINCWVKKARSLAFDSLSRTIIHTDNKKTDPPQNKLRSDEIVWGRSPARFDTGGGWSDTPPYSLEYGGCVVNTAVDLNGQSPIQAYLRVTDEPIITIGSIDLGTRIKISELDELLDYREPTSKYGLVKAALALSGFSPEYPVWPKDITLKQMLESFGGGIEITTLAAIPKGSGLGTSSIMGAVILAVIYRVMGQELVPRALFNKVLQLEQALTTGGGWQDQVGGVVGGVKIVYTSAGLVPDPRIHYLPSDIIEPSTNGGLTLLYYTGITRLAKNILEQVVGRYLDRNRESMSTLTKIHNLSGQVAEAFSRKDLPAFGQAVDAAWYLNKQLDPDSTNAQVEKLFDRVKPYIYGGKLLGAGGGGFMLMVCKSPEDAKLVRSILSDNPPNDRARFFDFNVNNQGLVVTVC